MSDTDKILAALADLQAGQGELRATVTELSAGQAAMQAELKVLGLEVRAGNAESRARDAELSTKVNTVVDALTDLRNEYRGHVHPEG